MFADLRGSPSPIFAAFGAIVAMSRTLNDAVKTCLTQFFGILLGAVCGIVYLGLLHDTYYIGIGLGLIGLILLCIQLKLQFAVSLASFVFVSICFSPEQNPFFYAANRLIDTSIGLATAMVINITLKPYNNRARIAELIQIFLQEVPDYVEQRVLGHYPDLSPLERQARLITDEIAVFEKQHVLHPKEHRQQVIYLKGCEQLTWALFEELHALCAMDEKGHLSEQNAERLTSMCVTVPEGAPSKTEADIVGNYHLSNLLNAYTFLTEFNLRE